MGRGKSKSKEITRTRRKKGKIIIRNGFIKAEKWVVRKVEKTRNGIERERYEYLTRNLKSQLDGHLIKTR